MSRSRKKHPILKDGGKSSKSQKKMANRAVRNYKEEIPSGSAYKKVYPSYDINDYVSYWSKEDAIHDYYKYRNEEYGIFRKFKTLKSVLNWWEKTMIKK